MPESDSHLAGFYVSGIIQFKEKIKTIIIFNWFHPSVDVCTYTQTFYCELSAE